METELHCDEKTVVIGHSSGAIAAMRYDPVELLPVCVVGIFAWETGVFLKFPLQRKKTVLTSKVVT